MFCPLSSFYFIIINIYFSFSISNANPSVDDNRLIAFMRGDQTIQFSEYTQQKYEAHLGIMYFMRKNWQCNKYGKEYLRTECQKYREYLHILFKYMFNEYVGVPVVKPKFAFKNKIVIEGPIIYAVKSLAKILQSYWGLERQSEYHRIYKFIPELLNKNKLNYELNVENKSKLPINEIILQLAIGTANEWQTNECIEEIIWLKFEERLEEMLKKARNEEHPGWSDYFTDKCTLEIIADSTSTFEDSDLWILYALFSEFVKGMATNFDKFINLQKSMMVNYKHFNYSIQKYEVYNNSIQKYEVYLGLVYLMRENWECATSNAKKAQMYSCRAQHVFVLIFYEYLYRIYVEAKNSELAKKLPAVRPLFFKYRSFFLDVFGIIKEMNNCSSFFWEKREPKNCILKLKNKEEVNFDQIYNKTHSLQKGKSKKSKNKKGKKEKPISHNLRAQFEHLMKEIYEKTKENAAKEKAKLDDEMLEEKEIDNLKYIFQVKFGTFTSSPFLKN